MTNKETVNWENSAEGRAIRRLASLDENTEWITLMEADEPINLEELNHLLKERGYNIQIPLDN